MTGLETTTLVDPTTGASLTLPAYFAPVELPPGIGTTAAVTPWERPDSFRANVNLRIDPATPERATTDQHASHLVAEVIASGAHVVAVDPYPVEGGETGRRVISAYPGLGSTVVQLQYAVARGGSLATVSVQSDAAGYRTGLQILGLASGTLSVPEPGVEVVPAPGTEPRVDDRLALRGEQQVDLSHVRSAQPYDGGVLLSAEELDTLRHTDRPEAPSVEAVPVLRRLSLTDASGAPTAEGAAALRALARPARMLTVKAETDSRSTSLRVHQDPGAAVVVAGPPPWELEARDTGGWWVQVVPPATTAIVLCRWIGLAPAPAVALGPHDPLELRAKDLAKRLAGESVAAPGDDAYVRQLWQQRWLHLLFVDGGSQEQELLATEAGGYYSIQRSRRTAQLGVQPAALVFDYLLGFSGFRLDAEERS